MIKSINATLNTGKKKVLAFVLSGTLILAIGSGAAYAANSLTATAKADNGNGTMIEDVEVRALSDDDGVSVKASVRTNGDGTLSYSADGGKTWSKEVPEGLEGFSFSVDQDGNGASGKLGN